MNTKSYFTNYKLFEALAVDIGGQIVRKIYSVDDSIIGALVIAHENCWLNFEIGSIKLASDHLVITPIDRTQYYKLFLADLRGEWDGREVYVVAGSLTAAARLLEEFCGTYYRVEKLVETSADKVVVNPHNPVKIED